MALVGDVPSSGLTYKNASSVNFGRLHEEFNDMKISDDKEMEATMVDGTETETGHIIVSTIGGKNGKNYNAVVHGIFAIWKD